jgi:hypothetical protein
VCGYTIEITDDFILLKRVRRCKLHDFVVFVTFSVLALFYENFVVWEVFIRVNLTGTKVSIIISQFFSVGKPGKFDV